MTYIELGIGELQKFVRNVGGLTPDNLYFGTTEITTVSGSEDLTSITEFIRTPLTWSQSGSNSKFTTVLASSDINGSYIKSFGFTNGDTIGSGILESINLSVLGSKNNLFSITVQGEVIITAN